MPILNFQKQFATSVKNGDKRQTIRSPRKHPIREGDTLYLYTGLRTKNTEKLNEVICDEVVDVEIGLRRVDIAGGFFWIDHQTDLDDFAKEDGFKNYDDMRRWFKDTHGLPFKGTLIKW